MRWTRGRRRGRWPQGELNLMSGAHRAERTALLRVRQNRVVPTPVAGAKLPVANSIQPDRLSHQAGSDGGKTNSSPGRARHKPSNHCAGNAGVFRLYLYARVRISLRTLHTRPRVQRAPGIPCSLRFRGKGSCKPRAHHAARTRSHIGVGWVERSVTHHPCALALMGIASLHPSYELAVIARSECDEAIHGSASGVMDCFAIARNDVETATLNSAPLTLRRLRSGRLEGPQCPYRRKLLISETLPSR
jgi:hypothetical protein